MTIKEANEAKFTNPYEALEAIGIDTSKFPIERGFVNLETGEPFDGYNGGKLMFGKRKQRERDYENYVKGIIDGYNTAVRKDQMQYEELRGFAAESKESILEELVVITNAIPSTKKKDTQEMLTRLIEKIHDSIEETWNYDCRFDTLKCYEDYEETK